MSGLLGHASEFSEQNSTSHFILMVFSISKSLISNISHGIVKNKKKQTKEHSNETNKQTHKQKQQQQKPSNLSGLGKKIT